jgi:hypothetical protein
MQDSQIEEAISQMSGCCLYHTQNHMQAMNQGTVLNVQQQVCHGAAVLEVTTTTY